MGEFECQADAAETGEGSSASPLQLDVVAEAEKHLSRLLGYFGKPVGIQLKELGHDAIVEHTVKVRVGDLIEALAFLEREDPVLCNHEWDDTGKIGALHSESRCKACGQYRYLPRQIEERSDTASLSNGGQPDTEKSEIVP